MVTTTLNAIQIRTLLAKATGCSVDQIEVFPDGPAADGEVAEAKIHTDIKGANRIDRALAKASK
jgi:hypothetical protein